MANNTKDFIVEQLKNKLKKWKKWKTYKKVKEWKSGRMKGYYFITDDALSKAGNLSDVKNAMAADVSVIQYRNKNSSVQKMCFEASQIKELCYRKNKLIINDRSDVALAVDVDGVHGHAENSYHLWKNGAKAIWFFIFPGRWMFVTRCGWCCGLILPGSGCITICGRTIKGLCCRSRFMVMSGRLRSFRCGRVGNRGSMFIWYRIRFTVYGLRFTKKEKESTSIWYRSWFMVYGCRFTVKDKR